MADVETSVPPVVEPTKDSVAEETKTELNGDHNNGTSAEVDKVTKSSEECVNGNGTANVTENGDSEHIDTEEKPASPETAEAEGEADAVTTEKKEEVIPKVIVHQFPPGKDIPNLSVFCLKLETFLRLNKIPYENQYGYKLGKKGKLPWIEYQGERKTDSTFIIEYLKEKFELQIDQGLSDEEKALGRAFKVLLEENTYWCLEYIRFIENYNEFKKLLTPSSGGGIGFNVALKMTQRRARANLDGQGMGKHSRDEIYKIMEKDIMAVSTFLGEKQYLLGDQMSSYDCTVFSFFSNVLWCGLESPMSTFIKEKANNLVAYCERVKEECWSDWADMILGDKPEPQLKKGFSFRKKRSKPTKSKDEKNETEAAEEEEKEETSKSPEETPKSPEETPKSPEEAPESPEEAPQLPEEKENTEEAKEETSDQKEEKPVVEDNAADETTSKATENDASEDQNGAKDSS